MKKAILAIAAAATIVVATVAAPDTADARPRGRNIGIGAAILGGAIIGGAIIANSYPRYRYAPGYVVYDGYYERYPVDCYGGYWARRPIHRHGEFVGWSRPRFVCP